MFKQIYKATLSVVRIAFLGSTVSAVAAAEKKLRFENRTRVEQSFILYVGECRLNQHSTSDLEGKPVISSSYEISYQICQQTIRYKIQVEGRGWSSKEIPVPGTDQPAQYIPKTLSKSFAGAQLRGSNIETQSMADHDKNMEAASLCAQQKSLLAKQAQLDQLASAFKLCKN